MKKILTILLLFIGLNTYSQCACVWLDINGVIQCHLYSSCSNPNLAHCANRVTSGTMCPCTVYPTMNWNCGGCLSNGACWYNGTACDAANVCSYIALPVELIEFKVEKNEESNLITWETVSENNSSHFVIKHTLDGENFEVLLLLPAMQNSTTITKYEIRHFDYPQKINYYLLEQVDLNGDVKQYGLISVDNRPNSERAIKTINVLGQEVGPEYKGLVIRIFSDLTSEMILQ